MCFNLLDYNTFSQGNGWRRLPATCHESAVHVAPRSGYELDRPCQMCQRISSDAWTSALGSPRIGVFRELSELRPKLPRVCWYVLGGMSLTCLRIFAWQWGRKHNNTEKNEAFWVKPHSCLILWQHGVFSFTKVCILYQWCLSNLYHNIHYVSVIFGK